MRLAVLLLQLRCVAALCLLSVSRTGAALYEDLAGASDASLPASTWIATNAAVFDGFCLQSAEGNVSLLVNASLSPLQSRSLLNWSQPLYSRSIGLFVVDDTAVAYVYEWIVKLLLQEVLGYQVTVHDILGDPYAIMLSSPGLIDADPVHYYQPYNPSSFLPSQHVEANLPGIYLPQRTLDAFPELMLDFWRSYDDATSTPQLVNASLSVFINDSWAGLINQYGQSVLNNSDGQFICPTDLPGFSDQGCVHGIYAPPRCQASPRTDCAVIYHSFPLYDSLFLSGGSITFFVRTMQLPFVVAYIDPLSKERQLAWLNSQGRHFIFWASSLEQEPHALCNDSSTGFCYGRMSLPTYSAACVETLGPPLTVSVYTANYSCDYSIHPMFNLVDPELQLTAPRAYSFFSSFVMTPTDTTAFYTLLGLQLAADPAQAERPDYKRLACSWITNNTQRWLPWIQPPALCSTTDLLFSQSDCRLSIATLTVSYSWNEPKACQLGIALPGPDVVSCDFLTLSLPSAAAAVALSCVVACLSLLMAALAWTAPYCRRRAVQQMTAAIQKQSAADKTAPQEATTKPTLRLSLWQRLSGSVASLLVSGLLSPSMIVLLLVGSCVLLAVNAVNIGNVSDAQCQTRLTLLLAGLSAWHAALFAASMRLFYVCRQRRILSLQEQLSRRLALGAGCLWAVQLVLLIVQAALGSSMAAQAVVIVPGGGQVVAAYCSAPTAWLEVVLATLNLTLGVFTLLTTLRSLTLLWLQTASKEKDRQNGIRKRVQAVTILCCQLLSLAASFSLVLTFVASNSSTGPENAARVQLEQAATLVYSVAMLLCLYGPSLAFVWWTQRRPAGSAGAQRGGQSTNRRHDSVDTSDGASLKSNGRSDSLAGTLSDPLCCAIFTQYCEDAHDAEPIHFLLAAQDFFRLLHQPQTSMAQLQQGSAHLMDEFLQPNGNQQVNISAQQLRQVEKALADVTVRAASYAQTAGPDKQANVCASEQCRTLARAAFEPVVKEVYAVLELNGFARFLQSSAAVRALDLVVWSEEFSAMTQREQKAAVERFHKLSSQQAKSPDLQSPQDSSRTSCLEARPLRERPAQQLLAGAKRSSEQQVAPEPLRPPSISQTQSWLA